MEKIRNISWLLKRNGYTDCHVFLQHDDAGRYHRFLAGSNLLIAKQKSVSGMTSAEF